MQITAKLDSTNLSKVDIIMEEKNGKVKRKTITLDDYVSALTTSCVSDGFTRIPDLPKGFFCGSVSESNSSSFQTVIIIPGGVHQMNYYGEVFMAPYPTMVFNLKCLMGRLVKSELWCTQTPNVKNDTPLYHFPYGNVYEDGRICWGGNVITDIPDMKGLDRVVGLFFGCESNNDLFHSKKFDNQRALIDAVKNLDEFPVQYLCKAGKVMADIM